MPEISVVIITYNEEKNIGRCLDSVKGIADDIIVVDSFSIDQTGRICSTKGVRFIQHAFPGHIEQKNWAITQARYPHVLSLDADEALSEELKMSILKIKNDWKYDGYYMNRSTNYCGKWIKHCGWYPDTKLRLWDSRKGKWGGINPHDKYELSEGCKSAYLKGDILHYSYYTIQQHFIQADKFSSIAADALFQKNKKVTWPLIILKTMAKFIRNYFIKTGFLDGYYGFMICRISAWETFQKYYKLKRLWENK